VQHEYLDRQTRAALGSAAGQNFPAVFCAHAFAEAVFSLLLEVRRLLKRKRHTGHPFEQNSTERRIIGARLRPVKPARAARSEIDFLPLDKGISLAAFEMVVHIEALLWTFSQKWTRLPQILCP
jgi:hypothetical protein